MRLRWDIPATPTRLVHGLQEHVREAGLREECIGARLLGGCAILGKHPAGDDQDEEVSGARVTAQAPHQLQAVEPWSTISVMNT